MNPIPLADPNGVVRAYLCGGCNQAFGPGGTRTGMTSPLDGHRLDEETERTHSRADRCCRCIDCRGDIAPRSLGLCDACEENNRAAQYWQRFCDEWHVIGRLVVNGITDRNQFCNQFQFRLLMEDL